MADRVIIMGQGEIAQMGVSKDIYRAPRTRFVAEFVGRNNIVSGTVSKVAGGKIHIDAPSGKFTIKAPSDAQQAKGDPISFAIGADFVILHSKKPTGKKIDNLVPVTLISEEFIGSVVTLFLEAPDGTEFKTQVQERELGSLDLQSGKQLYVNWPSERSHILED